MEKWKIGFVGTGVMGKSIVLHLLQAGHEVYVYNRSKEKANELVDAGATWIDSPAGIAGHCDLIFTMVGNPSDVEEIYLGDQGMLAHGKAGVIFVDLTTSTPSLAEELARQAAQKEIVVLDGPVSGGDIGAKNGTLSIMVGGEQEIYGTILPILQLFGSNIVYHGKAGAGQHVKMSNQIAIASNMIGVCEALVYAKKAGLDPELVLKSISQGAAGSWSLANLGPKMLAENYEPGFYIRHFVKDLKIALGEADSMNLSLPGLSLAAKLYEELAADGHELSGTQALITYWS
ncbi:NAD(P)-dependent oxidoreductase [Jeotgalibacillus soli]|uniref:Oxidoreductase n=1 Tax=Jeotgalibacillus soli TaxID=889306 RepID=A0A0C2VPE9_9BACL|nr:NAD(P)-dependent oxidoreductase [Jeotgalibacillus soli]KIL45888.1 oxidoreductase [Jeotgalibacillus soli]